MIGAILKIMKDLRKEYYKAQLCLTEKKIFNIFLAKNIKILYHLV